MKKTISINDMCNKLNNLLAKYKVNGRINSDYVDNTINKYSDYSCLSEFYIKYYSVVYIYCQKKAKTNKYFICAELKLRLRNGMTKTSEYRELAKSINLACDFVNEVNDSRLMFEIE